jgi:RNA polymerase sigma factor for flagellar operon FliA
MNKVEGLSSEELLERYLPLVRSIAHQIRQRLNLHLEMDELVQEGQIGLMEAAERFDSKLGVSFKTFAYYRVKGAIYDGLRKMDVITRRKNSKLMFEAAATELLASEAVRGSTEARKSTLKDEINEVVGMISGLVPIYILTSDAMDQFQQEQGGRAQDEQAMLKQEKMELRKALKELPEKERRLLEFHYYQDLTLEKAAANLGLSKSWASRLHAKAISKLQSKLVRKSQQK